MPDRSSDWFEQSLKDLEQARPACENGRHEWACFASQQAAEKAVKALHIASAQWAEGGMVADLLRDLPKMVSVPQDMVEKAKILDNYYIPTRYPNSHPHGAPFERYGPAQSKQAVEYAHQILKFVRSQMA